MTMKIFSGKLDVENVADTLKKINSIGKETGSVIVLFDAAKIAGKPHIESAVMHAKRSFSEGKNIARTLSMEILVYASGQRQCSLAPRFGLQKGQNQVYVLILDGDVERAEEEIRGLIEESNEVTATRETLKKEFDISEEEIGVVGEDRIGELVIERVAMLDAWR
ncbi:MAG: KEOPS complex subunit Cgi121 [Methanocorpusculum sp.]|uniref:KEOPS complex subunit Cgi121 n=1 Tax=Methanocorpusculum sp. TaxID=2058474 RepID=UPI00271CC59F|nr:KEOPS complex subunit Cgi121 [Methanocorpusculum sp.]MDO9522804.1 KEOPS complex subunit Cgi121 [Methanocorpusculum sp.]